MAIKFHLYHESTCSDYVKLYSDDFFGNMEILAKFGGGGGGGHDVIKIFNLHAIQCKFSNTPKIVNCIIMMLQKDT